MEERIKMRLLVDHCEKLPVRNKWPGALRCYKIKLVGFPYINILLFKKGFTWLTLDLLSN